MKFDVHAYWHNWDNMETMLHKKIVVEAPTATEAYDIGLNILDPSIQKMKSEWNFLNWVALPAPPTPQELADHEDAGRKEEKEQEARQERQIQQDLEDLQYILPD